MNQFVGLPAELLFSVIGGFGVYIFFDFKKQVNDKFDVLLQDQERIKQKMEKIETGDFVEKIVKSTIYAPESREYFKNIFKESLSHALAHQQKNDATPLINILDRLAEIEKKLP